MEKQNTKNFITSGNINRVILTIATPLMINNLIRTLYNLVLEQRLLLRNILEQMI